MDYYTYRNIGRIRIHNAPAKVPWFSKLNYKNRKFVTTVCRMRSRHCLFPKHKARIGISDSPDCTCGMEGDLDYIFLG